MLTARSRATVVGLAAPVCWGMSVGLVRDITERVGLTAGVALMCTLAAVLLWGVFGRPKPGLYSLRYLVFGIGAAVLCELCFATSLAMSSGGRQTVEVGMVNYLWPSLTVVFAIVFNGQKSRWWVVVGLAMAIVGVAVVLSGNKGFDCAEITRHMTDNPWSYCIAFVGALSWAAYCSMTKAWSGGNNPVVIIFGVNAVVFWLLYAAGYGPRLELSSASAALVAGAAVIMGLAYAAWTYGVMKGSLTILAIGSYFTPVLSCLFACFWLDAALSVYFWYGVALVVLGSLVCWRATCTGPRL